MAFNLQKYAMGADWGVYRQPYEWWSLDEIESGNASDWNEYAEINPSMNNALKEIKHFRNGRIEFFKQRYGLTSDEIKKIFYVNVGYHPTYGIYMCSIGPYYGAKRSDALNKFSYFTRRFQSANKEETLRSLYNAINKKFSEYSDILELSDFKLVINEETDEVSGPSGRYRKNKKVIENIDPNSPSGQELFETKPVLGTGSYFVPNAKGIAKLMEVSAERGEWKGILDRAINQIAQKNGISFEEAQVLMTSDENFVKDIFKAVKNIGKSFKQSNPELAEMIEDLPDFRIMGKPRVGAQRTEALKTRPIQFAMMHLKEEILKTMVENNTENIEEIANIMNNARSKSKSTMLKAQGVFTPEIIQFWLDELASERTIEDDNGNIVGEKPYAMLLEETRNDIQELYDNKGAKEEGYDDLDTAFQMASLYYAESPKETIDPKTRAKMTIGFNPPPMFKKEDDAVNVTSEDLQKWRLEQIEIEERETEEGNVEEDLDIENPEGIIENPEEIIENPSENTNDFEITEVPQEEIITQQPIPEKPKEEEEDIYNEFNLNDLMSGTLNNLIKIANELNKEGKINSAMKIQKVIKKYKGRLK